MRHSIEPASDRHIAGILAIYNDVIATSTAVYSTEPVTLEDRRTWLAARQRDGFPVLVALDQDQDVIGFCSFGPWRGAWSGYRHTVEHSVHVRADRRGLGVGRTLVEALFPIAIGTGKHVMTGGIDATNDASLRLHQRLGFEAVSHFREVGHKFGRWLDLIFVQKILTPGQGPAAADNGGADRLFTLKQDDLSGGAAQTLLALHLRGMHENSPPGACFALDLTALSSPEITVWSVWDGACIVGIGALRMLGAGLAEVKSMRTHPDHLGRGVGGQLLDHIIAVARDRGVSRLSLETGSSPAFAAAIALYQRRGFVEGDRFADYQPNGFNRFFHLAL